MLSNFKGQSAGLSKKSGENLMFGFTTTVLLKSYCRQYVNVLGIYRKTFRFYAKTNWIRYPG